MHVVLKVVTLKQGKGVVVRLFTVPIKFYFTLREFGVLEAAHRLFTGVFTFDRVGFQHLLCGFFGSRGKDDIQGRWFSEFELTEPARARFSMWPMEGEKMD